MKLESLGILINIRPISERDSIARIFTSDFGIMCGVMRGAVVARKNKPLVGQVGVVSWNARLDTQLGQFHWESEKNLAAILMSDGRKLAFMNAAFDLISLLLPEREKYELLYKDTLTLMQNLSYESEYQTYLNWEVVLLRELGYALDLAHCSGCGTDADLNYLSPRTGRAVCEKCAAPYVGRLFELPLNLDTMLKFLDNICLNQGVQTPQSRRFLMK